MPPFKRDVNVVHCDMAKVLKLSRTRRLENFVFRNVDLYMGYKIRVEWSCLMRHLYIVALDCRMYYASNAGFSRKIGEEQCRMVAQKNLGDIETRFPGDKIRHYNDLKSFRK